MPRWGGDAGALQVCRVHNQLVLDIAAQRQCGGRNKSAQERSRRVAGWMTWETNTRHQNVLIQRTEQGTCRKLRSRRSLHTQHCGCDLFIPSCSELAQAGRRRERWTALNCPWVATGIGCLAQGAAQPVTQSAVTVSAWSDLRSGLGRQCSGQRLATSCHRRTV